MTRVSRIPVLSGNHPIVNVIYSTENMHRFAGQHNCKMGQELHETDEQVEIGPVHWQCDVFVCLTSAARVTRFMGSRQAKVASSLEANRSKQCVSVGFA